MDYYLSLRDNLIELFWSKVDKREDHQCWIWKGAKDNWGYGVFIVKDKKDKATLRAVRVMMYLQGKNVEGEIIKQTCSSKLCCNPNHLQIGRKAKEPKLKRGTIIVQKGSLVKFENGPE
jgi:hypothetical protein